MKIQFFFLSKSSNNSQSYLRGMDQKLHDQLDTVVKFFKPDSKIVILTGAGISAESGIPTFRGKGGLWEKYDPAVVATAEALKLRPEKVWEMHDELRQIIHSCKPNPAHEAIAEFEKYFNDVTVITQNVDNLHQDAGSTKVLELHGNAWRVKCTVEAKIWVDKTVPYKDLPPKCSCGAMLRPDVVFFGEGLDQDILNSAFSIANSADIMLVLGTSYVVVPAAYLPVMAQQNGAVIIDINIETTPIPVFTDASIVGNAGIVLPELVRSIKKKFND